MKYLFLFLSCSFLFAYSNTNTSNTFSVQKSIEGLTRKQTKTDKAKLVRGESYLARTSYNPETKKQKIKFKEEVRASIKERKGYTTGYLIYAIDEIPDLEQQILIAELMKKGY